jgi:hypothetical protein
MVMNADDTEETIEKPAYRDWWEIDGRSDPGLCPCGRPAGEGRSGLCPLHVHMTDREGLAQGILAGTFVEPNMAGDEMGGRMTRLIALGFVGKRIQEERSR